MTGKKSLSPLAPPPVTNETRWAFATAYHLQIYTLLQGQAQAFGYKIFLDPPTKETPDLVYHLVPWDALTVGPATVAATLRAQAADMLGQDLSWSGPESLRETRHGAFIFTATLDKGMGLLFVIHPSVIMMP